MDIELLKYFEETIHKDFFINEDEIVVCIKKPNFLKNFENVITDIEQHKTYFKYLEDDRIKDMNMCHNILEYSFYKFKCFYCNTHPSSDDISYFCMNCNEAMCNLCFDEDTEEKALANGAKNWHLRKEKLEECRKHDLRKIYKMKNEENEEEYFYSLDFGSMLDWLLVYNEYKEKYDIDNDIHDFIVKCCNPENKHFGKYALCSVDSHGRSGYYVTDLSFEEIKKRIKENINIRGEDDYDNYWSPIKTLMCDLGFTTNYG